MSVPYGLKRPPEGRALLLLHPDGVWWMHLLDPARDRRMSPAEVKAVAQT